MKFYKTLLKVILVIALLAVMLSFVACVSIGNSTQNPTLDETLITTDHDHEHQWALIETIEPWFERSGFTRYSCGICGTEFDTDFVNPLVKFTRFDLR